MAEILQNRELEAYRFDPNMTFKSFQHQVELLSAVRADRRRRLGFLLALKGDERDFISSEIRAHAHEAINSVSEAIERDTGALYKLAHIAYRHSWGGHGWFILLPADIEQKWEKEATGQGFSPYEYALWLDLLKEENSMESNL